MAPSEMKSLQVCVRQELNKRMEMTEQGSDDGLGQVRLEKQELPHTWDPEFAKPTGRWKER